MPVLDSQQQPVVPIVIGLPAGHSKGEMGVGGGGEVLGDPCPEAYWSGRVGGRIGMAFRRQPCDEFQQLRVEAQVFELSSDRESMIGDSPVTVESQC